MIYLGNQAVGTTNTIPQHGLIEVGYQNSAGAGLNIDGLTLYVATSPFDLNGDPEEQVDLFQEPEITVYTSQRYFYAPRGTYVLMAFFADGPMLAQVDAGEERISVPSVSGGGGDHYYLALTFPLPIDAEIEYVSVFVERDSEVNT